MELWCQEAPTSPLSGMNENAIHNGAVDEYSPFRFALSIFAFSPLVSRINLRATARPRRHHHLLFEIRDDDLYAGLHSTRIPSGWMEFPQRCDVSVRSRAPPWQQLGDVRCEQARKALDFSSQYDAWPRPPKVFFIIILPVHGFISVNFSCTEPGEREHPQTKPFMFVLASAPDPKRRPDVVPADTAHFSSRLTSLAQQCLWCHASDQGRASRPIPRLISSF